MSNIYFNQNTIKDEILARVLFGETAIKQFGGINIGDLDKIISYMCLNYS